MCTQPRAWPSPLRPSNWSRRILHFTTPLQMNPRSYALLLEDDFIPCPLAMDEMYVRVCFHLFFCNTGMLSLCVCLPFCAKKSTTAICATTLVVLQVCFALYTHTPTATCKQNIPQSPPAAKPAQRNYLLTEMMQLRDSPRDKWMHDRQGIQQRQLQ